MTKPAGLSLDAIAAQVVTDDAVAFRPMLPDGEDAPFELLIRSEQSPTVEAAISKLVNTQRKKDQIEAAKAAKARPGEVVRPAEDDELHYRRLVATRIAGWNGLDDEFNEENLLRLLKLIPSLNSQIVDRSKELGSFTKTSAKA